jgi:hypothetical protein
MLRRRLTDGLRAAHHAAFAKWSLRATSGSSGKAAFTGSVTMMLPVKGTTGCAASGSHRYAQAILAAAPGLGPRAPLGRR